MGRLFRTKPKVKVGDRIVIFNEGTNRADLWCTITLIEGIIIYFTVINGAWEGNIQENVMTVHRTRDKFPIEYIKYQESFNDYNNALFEADKLLKKPPVIRDICLFWVNNKSGVSEIGKRLKLCYTACKNIMKTGKAQIYYYNDDIPF